MARQPSLVVWAVGNGQATAVDDLLAPGFDVDAMGRADVPDDQPWATALHHAAGNGDTAVVRRLLAAGADPSRTDARFHSTPLGWARHFGHEDTAAVLEAVTPE